MTKGKRIALAIVLGWLGWGVANQFVAPPTAMLTGAAVGGATWLLTARRAS